MQGRTKVLVLVMVLGLIAVLLTAGGVALAMHNDPDELHACYNNSRHLLIIDDPANCGNNETAVSWNQQGLQGPQGLIGLTGPAGANGLTGPQGNPGQQGNPGPAGAGGLSNFEIVFTTSPLASDQFVAISLPCPAGKQVISGGFDIQSQGGGVIEIVTSGPFNFGWAVRARASANFQNNQWQLAVTALCATVAP